MIPSPPDTELILDWIKDTFPLYKYPDVSRGMCHVVAQAIQVEFGTGIVYAESQTPLPDDDLYADHYAALTPSGIVIDPTMNQFNPDLTWPFVANPDTWLNHLKSAWHSPAIIQINPRH